MQALRDVCPETRERQHSLILHIGRGKTIIAGFDRQGLYASRHLAINEQEILQGLMLPFKTADGRVELTMEDAEEIQQVLDITEECPVTLPDGRNVQSAQLFAQIRPRLERLSVEIAKFIRLHTPTGMRPAAMGPLFVTGLGATWKGLAQFLEREIRIETSTLDPFSIFEESESKEQSGSSLEERPGFSASNLPPFRERCSLALALGYALDTETAIDFTPIPLRLRRIQLLSRWGLRIVGAGLVSLFGFLAWQNDALGERLGNSVVVQEDALIELEEQAERVHRAHQLKSDIETFKTDVRERMATTPNLYRDLKHLVSMLPRALYLDRVEVNRSTFTYDITLQGHLIGIKESGPARLEFLNTLDHFRATGHDVEIQFKESKGQDLVSFFASIRLQIPNPLESLDLEEEE